MSEYRDTWYHSDDGLRLYARDYPCADASVAEPLTVLCMHGLTRNSADFAGLASHLSQRYRVLVVDVRGRGRSDNDSNPENYNPMIYARDMFALLDHLGLERAVLCGTSMGALMSYIMAATQPARISGIILNDAGPEVDPRGLARIKGYVGKAKPVTSWAEAARQVREINRAAFPEYTEEDWLEFARATYRERDGELEPAYDPAIARPIAEAESAAVPADLWPVFKSLGELPALVVRGELSDILSRECVASMCESKPDLQSVEVPRRGHAPTLTEPAALAAIDSFLDELG